MRGEQADSPLGTGAMGINRKGPMVSGPCSGSRDKESFILEPELLVLQRELRLPCMHTSLGMKGASLFTFKCALIRGGDHSVMVLADGTAQREDELRQRRKCRVPIFRFRLRAPFLPPSLAGRG